MPHGLRSKVNFGLYFSFFSIFLPLTKEIIPLTKFFWSFQKMPLRLSHVIINISCSKLYQNNN